MQKDAPPIPKPSRGSTRPKPKLVTLCPHGPSLLSPQVLAFPERTRSGDSEAVQLCTSGPDSPTPPGPRLERGFPDPVRLGLRPSVAWPADLPNVHRAGPS